MSNIPVKNGFLKLVLYMGLLCFTFSGFAQILPGIYSMNEYLPLLKGKKVGVVANQTSYIKNTHLVDTLLLRKVKVVKIYSPEHGFLGNASAGVYIGNERYSGKKKIPVISLYGKKKMPTAKDLQGINVMVFDIQDVGVRFYTYISTLTYIMEACARHHIPVILLDRPNPNGFYVDGPVLQPKYRSFVGLHPVPIVYGMTIGEYGLMVNGERWLPDSLYCDLKVIKVKGYTHDSIYELPQNPSPNLRTKEAIMLYPSLCLFEGTNVSIGRGTEYPFEIVGKPGFKSGNFTFTPRSVTGVAEQPLYENTECRGYRLSDFADEFIPSYRRIYLFWLKGMYDEISTSDTFYSRLLEKVSENVVDTSILIDDQGNNSVSISWENDFIRFMTEWLKGSYENYNRQEELTKFLDSLGIIRNNRLLVTNPDSMNRIIMQNLPEIQNILYEWIKHFKSNRQAFFTGYFNRLAGTDQLKKQIINGESVENILASWEPGLQQFMKIRSKYLLYPDFERKAKIYFLK